MFIVQKLENKDKQKDGRTPFPKINVAHFLVCIIPDFTYVSMHIYTYTRFP